MTAQGGLFDGGLTVVNGHAPVGEWVAPRVEDLPDRLGGVVGIDLETRDEGLKSGRGPGWALPDGGRVVGYAVAADGFSTYLPVGHEGGGNLDPGQVRRWLNHVLSDPAQPKVGANVVLYDAGWWEADGVEVAGPLYDVQWTEVLLDDSRYSYALNAIARHRLDREKDEAALREAAKSFGLDPKSDMWRLPATFVGGYATEDAVLARDVFAVQRPLVDELGLSDLWQLEHDLGPLYRSMRRRGVRVDVAYLEQLRDQFVAERDEVVAEIRRRTGVRVDIWAAESLAPAFDAAGVAYPRTPKTGAPSITKDLFATSEHWLPRAVLSAREKDKLASTFIESMLLGNLVGDRVHPEMHPLRYDDDSNRGMKGAITGRASMSNPTLQNIPTRTEEGKRLRKALLPEEGELWASPDFSGQEPRLLVHFASLVRRAGEPLPGAIEARDRFRAEPGMSYHAYVAGITKLDKYTAKELNLARIYGRGAATTAAALGVPLEEVQRWFRLHAEALPFLDAMNEIVQTQVRQRASGREGVGYVRSLLGRRVQFARWELRGRWDGELRRFVRPLGPDGREDRREFPRWKARRVWPGQRVEVARLHKALNTLIQPSAADQTKAAMREVVRAGHGERLLFQVHDELPASVPDERVAREIADAMRDAVRLEVPSVVEVEVGRSWGDAK